MKWPLRSTLRWFPLLLCLLLLALFLTACGFWGNTGNTSANTIPTAAPLHVTTYTGDGYSIDYPQNWTAKKNGNVVVFSDPPGLSTLIVEYASNPGGELSASSAVDGGLSGFQGEAKNYQKVTIAPTTSVGGENWSQGAATGLAAYKGQDLGMKFVVLADSHQAHSPSAKTFVIIYGTDNTVFDAASQAIFQPMLQSFKFH